jgi:hypothetical protein
MGTASVTKRDVIGGLEKNNTCDEGIKGFCDEIPYGDNPAVW